MAKSPGVEGQYAAPDLRAWIGAVRGLGKLREVKGATWKLEIGTLTDLNAKGPKWTLLFDEIEGHLPGYRILTGSLPDARRVALTFGLSPRLSDRELAESLRGRLSGVREKLSQYRAVRVKESRLFENVAEGSRVDITRFPAPLWHEHDGGRYLGTADAVVTRDPETGWVNVGAYRSMVHARDRLGLFVNVSHHGRLHAEKFWQRGEKCPVAISFGHHPLIFALAGLEVPAGFSEFDYAGALAERQYPVVEGPVTGLPIPADSEVAIEGHISAELKSEGPYGEFLGYYAGGAMQNPVIEVAAVYHRDQPIILGTAAGRPPYDYSYFRCPIRSAMLWNALESAGVPGIQGVWCHEAGYSRAFTVVSIKQAHAGHAVQAAHLAAQLRETVFGGKYVVVVDEDIDPTSLEDVVWTICSRTDPVKSIAFIPDASGINLDPMVEQEETRLEELRMSRALIYACRPMDRLLRGTFPRVVESSAEIRESVRKKWSALFETDA